MEIVIHAKVILDQMDNVKEIKLGLYVEPKDVKIHQIILQMNYVKNISLIVLQMVLVVFKIYNLVVVIKEILNYVLLIKEVMVIVKVMRKRKIVINNAWLEFVMKHQLICIQMKNATHIR